MIDVWRHRSLKTAAKIRKLFRDQGGCCFYCSTECSFTVGTRSPIRATLDHKLARSKGGTWAIRNLVMACYRCNQLKGSHDFIWFRDSVSLIGIEEMQLVFDFKVEESKKASRARRTERRRERTQAITEGLAILMYVVDRWPPAWYNESLQMEMAA